MNNKNYNAIIPAENDKRVKNKALCDNEGNYFSLQDGRARWQSRKGKSINFAKIFHALGAEELKKAEDNGTLEINKKTGEVFDTPEARKYFLKSIRMSECSLRLGYKVDGENVIKLVNAHFCRDRLCPICMWRLSRRLAWETSQIMDRYMIENPDMIPILISLTVKNPKMGELSNMLDVLCHGKSGAWQLLQKWLSRRGIKDYIRTVEVTFNHVAQSWHPHIHVLAFVHKNYFSKENKNYISHEILKKEWQRICNLDYEPYVDIRRCYDKKAGANERIDFNGDIKMVSLAGAIKETAKYCVKPLKIFSNANGSYADEHGAEEKKEKINVKAVVRELDNALSGRRLRAMGGKLKIIAKELKLDDDESKKDLIHSDNSSTSEAIWEEIYEYVFEDKDYYLTAREEVGQEQERVEMNIDLQENSGDKSMKDFNTIKGRHIQNVDGKLEIYKEKSYSWHIPKYLRDKNIKKGDVVLVKTRKTNDVVQVIVEDVFREDIEETGKKYKAVIDKVENVSEEINALRESYYEQERNNSEVKRE